jgi:hypothetical protein
LTSEAQRGAASSASSSSKASSSLVKTASFLVRVYVELADNPVTLADEDHDLGAG